MESNQTGLRTLLLSAVGVLLVETAATVFIPKGICHPMAIVGFVRCLQVILLLVIFTSTENQGLATMGLARGRIIRGLNTGLLWSFGFGVLMTVIFSLIFLIFGRDPISLIGASLPERYPEIALYFFVGGIVAPVAEEVFFRGVLYGFFRRWGVWPALLLSTLIFVAFHSTGTNIPFTQIIGGIVFALAYEAGKSILTPITIHALGNMAIFCLAWVRY